MRRARARWGVVSKCIGSHGVRLLKAMGTGMLWLRISRMSLSGQSVESHAAVVERRPTISRNVLLPPPGEACKAARGLSLLSKEAPCMILLTCLSLRATRARVTSFKVSPRLAFAKVLRFVPRADVGRPEMSAFV